jgi:hypothetical protein
MKQLPYNQMVIGLDKLFFTLSDSTQDQLETIEAYLEGCGWSWDLILEEMCREQAPALPTGTNN